MTPRGRRDARALGARLAGGGTILGLEGVPAPELGVCSAAVRTRQTADLVAAAMGTGLPLDAYHSLYGAGTESVLQYVREVDPQVTSILVVGHNPTMEHLAWELLADGGGQGAGDRITLEAHRFPTCAVAVLALAVPEWEEVALGCATLAGLFTPPY